MDKVMMPLMRGPFATDWRIQVPAGKWQTWGEYRNNFIPPMTDPLGRVWDQPKREDIYLQHGKAYMSTSSAFLLKNYSHSIPSGVYVGKMWKRIDNQGQAYLMWYGHHRDQSLVSINERPIVVTDGTPDYYLDDH